MTTIRKPRPTPDNIRLACDVALLFMWLHVDYHDFRGYEIATMEAFAHPMGSYENVFWWSVRTLYLEPHLDGGDPASLSAFGGYFKWKLEQHATKRVSSESELFPSRRRST